MWLAMTMLNRFLATVLALLLTLGAGASCAIAQQASGQQGSSAVSLRTELGDKIARMASLDRREIEVRATGSVIRVLIINTIYNQDPSSEREYLASAISALVKTSAEKDVRYDAIVAILVEFVHRGRWSSKPVETIEFRKGADGAFLRHST